MKLWVRLITTVCLFFSFWLCAYGFQATEAIHPSAVKTAVGLFGLGSAGWIVYSIATLGRSSGR